MLLKILRDHARSIVQRGDVLDATPAKIIA
jgi:hypothetical protein